MLAGLKDVEKGKVLRIEEILGYTKKCLNLKLPLSIGRGPRFKMLFQSKNICFPVFCQRGRSLLFLTQSFEVVACAFPKLYPQSLEKKNVRRAVLTKVLSVYYRIYKGKIEVLAILDNRCEISNWL